MRPISRKLCFPSDTGMQLTSNRPPSGEGVNHALHDSVELAQQIIKHGLDDLDGAVLEYEKSMQARAIKHSQKSTMMNNVFFAPGGARGILKAFGMEEGDAHRK